MKTVLIAGASSAMQIFSAAPQGGAVTTARDVAAATSKAVTDPSSPQRTPAGADAVTLAGIPTT